MGLSIRAYARHRGVSHTAVQKAVKAGRIPLRPDGTIDPAEADRSWETNANPLRSEPSRSEAPRSGAPRSTVPETPVGPTYAQSRAIREAYAARLARLDYEERTGQLLRTEQVRVAWFDLLRLTRDRLLTLPDRLADPLAAETETRRVHALLLDEIRTVLDDLADRAERMGGQHG